MNVVESVAPSGSVDFVVRRAREGYHKAPLSWKIRNYRNYFWMAWERIGLFFAHIFKLSVITSELRIKVIKPWVRLSITARLAAVSSPRSVEVSSLMHS